MIRFKKILAVLCRPSVYSMIAATIFCIPLFAQPITKTDSLLAIAWLEKAVVLEDDEHQYEDAIALYRKCLPVFKSCGDQVGYFKAKIGIAYSYFENGQHEMALSQIHETIIEIEALPSGKIPIMKLGDAWLAKGNIHYGAPLEVELAIANYEKALTVFHRLSDDDVGKEKRIAAVFNNLGSIHLKAQKFPKALEYINQALDLKKKVLGPAHSSTLSTMGVQAEIWLEMGYLNKSVELQRELVEISKAADDQKGLARSYRNISQTYQRKKDFKTAEEYIRMAIDIFEKYDSQNLQKRAYCEYQMGNVLKAAGRYEEAIFWFETANEKHNKAHGIPNVHTATTTEEIAMVYTYLENYDMALKIYQQVWDLFDKILPKDHHLYAELWFNLGACYIEKGELEEADKMYSKAYMLAKNVMPEGSYDRAQSCYYLATTTKDINSALSLCQEGLQGVSTGFSAKNLFDNPPIENIFQEQTGLRLFQQKITLLERAFDESGDKKYLDRALETTEVASSLVDLLRQSFFTESAKNYLAENARNIYEAGVRVAFHLQEIQPNPIFLEQAFEFMEKSRSLSLLEELQSDAANQLVKIPDSLAFEKEVLQKEVLLLETQFQLARSDKDKSRKINEQLFSAKEKKAALEKHIGQHYPEIVQLMKNMEIINIADVQGLMAVGEVMLEYLVTESHLFLLKVTKEKAELSRAPLPQNFQSQIVDFVQLIKDPVLAANASMGLEVYHDFTKKSRDIYQTLIGEGLNGSEQKVLIIPDLWLSYLPYEILLTEDGFPAQKVDYSSLPYLFRKCPIRYAFSANLQFSRSRHHKKNNHSVLAYAPEYQGSTNNELATRSGFSSLTQTTKEVADISELLGGTAVTGPLANEANFKANATDYGVLHLAMHAFTDEDNPMVSGLIFSDSEDGEDGVLRAYELQGMKLNAQLAVLSACNTGSGKLEKGEGIMSLGRSFRRAGVPNILMSLWQVDDEATRQIMANFYTHLKAGQPTDAALRQAKLDYLENGRKTFPFYWSAFVFMGDNKGVDFVQPVSDSLLFISFGALGFILLLFGAWFYWKKDWKKSISPTWL